MFSCPGSVSVIQANRKILRVCDNSNKSYKVNLLFLLEMAVTEYENLFMKIRRELQKGPCSQKDLIKKCGLTSKESGRISRTVKRLMETYTVKITVKPIPRGKYRSRGRPEQLLWLKNYKPPIRVWE